jgi:hypothetical protein
MFVDLTYGRVLLALDFRDISGRKSGRVTFITPLVSLPLIFVQKHIIQFTLLSLIFTFTNPPPPHLWGQFISFRELH